jgi:uncharacterized membrane protein
MKTRKRLLRALAGVLTFACIATAANAPKLTFKFTTINVKGSEETDTYAINNAGVIVGDYIDSSGKMHGLKLVGRKVTNIDDPNATGGTICNDINSSDAIVGSYVNSSGATKGFLYKNGKFTDVVPPGATTFSEANGINDQGEIVGDYDDSSGVDVGFLLKGNNYTTLDLSGSTFTLAYGINNSGWITIIWGDSAGNSESSLYDSKTKEYSKKPINVPDAASSWAHLIDTAGDIVYRWTDSAGITHGALCTKCTSNGRKYYKFDDPKGSNLRADGINDHRTIVGRFIPTKSSEFEGFKATY